MPLSERQNKPNNEKRAAAHAFRFSSGVRNANTILQSKKNSARRRSADPHARLSARLRHISFGAAVLLVVAAALTVIYSLYKIQIRDGATYRQYAAEQQLLDSTIQATRGEIYDTSGITLASTSVVWTIWADPSYSTALYTTTTDQDTKAETRTIDEAAMKEVCTQITLRLLSGDGESLDSVDTTSAEYQTQYQAVCDALSQNESSYQVLATKVNNAIKLSIEEYVKTYNKAHSKSGNPPVRWKNSGQAGSGPAGERRRHPHCPQGAGVGVGLQGLPAGLPLRPLCRRRAGLLQCGWSGRVRSGKLL